MRAAQAAVAAGRHHHGGSRGRGSLGSANKAVPGQQRLRRGRRFVNEDAAGLDPISHGRVVHDQEFAAHRRVARVHQHILHVLTRTGGQHRQHTALCHQSRDTGRTVAPRRRRQQGLPPTVIDLKQAAHVQGLVRLHPQQPSLRAGTAFKERRHPLRNLPAPGQGQGFLKEVAVESFELKANARRLIVAVDHRDQRVASFAQIHVGTTPNPPPPPRAASPRRSVRGSRARSDHA